MRPLVIVRPQPAASATAKAAEGLGLTTIKIPLFEIEPMEWNAPDPALFDALLLTSANAVCHGGGELERLRSLPAHCVGEMTATAASQAGLTIGTVGIFGIDSLLRSLPVGLHLLHLCGIDRRHPAAPAQAIEHIPVYRAVEIANLGNLDRLEGSVVTVHSPRAAARLAAVADAAGLDRTTIAVAAISMDSGRAAGGGWQRVEAADEPADSALLALASRLCNNRR